MIKIIYESDVKEQNIIPMREMDPYSIAIVMEGMREGDYVMRSANLASFEVFNLTNPSPGRCWGKCELKVRLLNKGESITLKLFNEEES